MKFLLKFAAIMMPGLGVIAQEVPKIVDLSPVPWSTNVNASVTKKIVVTFDQDMRSGFSSWLGRSGVLPDSDLKPSEKDSRTFELNVDLRPGKVYVFALNEKRIPGVGFQSKKGVPAPSFFLVFQTAGTIAPDDSPPRPVSTIPVSNSRIDPARLNSISVTFDKAMQNAKHGMHMRENQKEVDLSKARFQYAGDGKTFTLAYDFKPASTYEFELNSVHDIGFASAKRVPLWPGKFAFSTQ